MVWAQETGINTNAEWYPGLTEKSSFEAFQAFLANDPSSGCPRPCHSTSTAGGTSATTADGMSAKAAAEADQVGELSTLIGFLEGDRIVGANDQWCSTREVQSGWTISGCGKNRGLKVKILTYNLFWWNLFRIRKGNGGSAGKLIRQAAGGEPFDFMGFQECEDVRRVLGDAGMLGDFEGVWGPHAMCVAYRKSAWRQLGTSQRNVAEDRWDQWYGMRAGMWVRLQHIQTGQVVFFVNHHGPLPVDTGGVCGGEATAYNLLKLIAGNAYRDDVVVLVGDFNAGPNSETVRALRPHLHEAYTGNSFGGVDHVFSSCPNVVSNRILGSGGSDHDALETVLRI